MAQAISPAVKPPRWVLQPMEDASTTLKPMLMAMFEINVWGDIAGLPNNCKHTRAPRIPPTAPEAPAPAKGPGWASTVTKFPKTKAAQKIMRK